MAVSRNHYHFFKASLPVLESKEKSELEKEARNTLLSYLNKSGTILPWDMSSSLVALTLDHLPTPTSLRCYFDQIWLETGQKAYIQFRMGHDVPYPEISENVPL